MDLASERLASLQVQMEQIRDGLEDTALKLVVVQHGIHQVAEVRDTLEKAAINLSAVERIVEQVGNERANVQATIEKLRNSRTLAMPPNWRELARTDVTAAIVFLDNLDEHVMRDAIGQVKAETREALCRWACNGHEGIPG
jgi:hypothetical protein